MSAVFRLLCDELRKANAAFYRDPRTSHLPLLGPPWQMFVVLSLYLLVVTRWGPRFMQDRKPFNVKVPMQIYNVLQVLLNLYVFVESVRLTYTKPYFKFSCQRYDPLDMSEPYMLMRYAGYVYYITKYLDLFDTVFFLLRKNYRQITFLHLYHHTLMVYAVWAYMTLLFASHYTATGVINSFVHVCMYSYYFVSTLQLRTDLTRFKRLLTQMQIAQFCYLTVHFSLPLFNNWCGLDLFWTWVAFLQNLFMLLLFADFYYKTYVLKARTVSANGHANGSTNGIVTNGKKALKVH